MGHRCRASGATGKGYVSRRLPDALQARVNRTGLERRSYHSRASKTGTESNSTSVCLEMQVATCMG